MTDELDTPAPDDGSQDPPVDDVALDPVEPVDRIHTQEGDEETDEDGLFPAPVTPAPHTGDGVIDAALGALEDSARTGDLDAQIEAGERVHRELQERLSDLGNA